MSTFRPPASGSASDSASFSSSSASPAPPCRPPHSHAHVKRKAASNCGVDTRRARLDCHGASEHEYAVAASSSHDVARESDGVDLSDLDLEVTSVPTSVDRATGTTTHRLFPDSSKDVTDRDNGDKVEFLATTTMMAWLMDNASPRERAHAQDVLESLLCRIWRRQAQSQDQIQPLRQMWHFMKLDRGARACRTANRRRPTTRGIKMTDTYLEVSVSI